MGSSKVLCAGLVRELASSVSAGQSGLCCQDSRLERHLPGGMPFSSPCSHPTEIPPGNSPIPDSSPPLPEGGTSLPRVCAAGSSAEAVCCPVCRPCGQELGPPHRLVSVRAFANQQKTLDPVPSHPNLFCLGAEQDRALLRSFAPLILLPKPLWVPSGEFPTARTSSGPQ